MIDLPTMTRGLFTLLVAYLLGSLPTALIIARVIAGVDIREIGDGNMGARNITHTLGWGPGITVAIIDFSKGSLSVFLAQVFRLGLGWQLVACAFAVLGHDFPIYASLRGGQGMAAILGGLIVLMPRETLVGMLVFGIVYLIIRNFDPSAALGLALLAFMAWLWDEPIQLIGCTILLFLSIPAKKAIDQPRRRRLNKQTAQAEQNHETHPVSLR